jgi:phosphoglucosamine mutase
VVLDCANGAAYKVAPAVFEELGAEVIVLGNQPNGFNVNDKSGALYPVKMTDAVVKYRADVGVSLDGDADRVIMADEKGRVVNGDHILAMAAIYLKERGRLPKNTIVATHMSNFALDQLMNENGIQVIRTDVGDKHVVQEMREYGYTLGGEQSGHIIFLEHSTTGDGCVAALNVIAVMMATGKSLSELNDIMQEVPQILINTRIKRKKELNTMQGYGELKAQIEKKLDKKGRILVRYSGTENVARVLVEGPDKRKISEYAQEMASFLEKNLN